MRANSEYWKEYQDQFRELFDKDFYQKQREEIMSTGYVVDSLMVNRELIDEKCQKLIECLGQLDLFMNVEYLLSLLDDLAEKNFY